MPVVPDWLNWASALGGAAGGIGTMLACALAYWAAAKVIPDQIRAFRRTKLEEKQSDAAHSLWMATARFTYSVLQLQDGYAAAFRKANQNVPESASSTRSNYIETQVSDLREEASERGMAVNEALSLVRLLLGHEFDRAVIGLTHEYLAMNDHALFLVASSEKRVITDAEIANFNSREAVRRFESRANYIFKQLRATARLDGSAAETPNVVPDIRALSDEPSARSLIRQMTMRRLTGVGVVESESEEAPAVEVGEGSVDDEEISIREKKRREKKRAGR